MLRLLLIALTLTACGGSDVSRQVGARCDTNDDCDERCLLDRDGWPGGFCTISCDDDTDCPDLTLCSNDEAGSCLFQCGGDPDCTFLGDGWTCQVRSGRPSGQVMVCVGP